MRSERPCPIQIVDTCTSLSERTRLKLFLLAATCRRLDRTVNEPQSFSARDACLTRSRGGVPFVGGFLTAYVSIEQ
jgi:hypothetical protein